jgi:phosphoglycerate dehydrogenase-like enzyme
MAQSLQSKIKLLVLSDPAAPHLRVLNQIGSAAEMVTGIDKSTIESAAPDAEVIFNARFNSDHLRQIWPLARNLRWVHSMAAGVETILFPALLESAVLLTNGRGVFKRSLAEFVTAAVLFFAKDLRRMLRNQAQGRWEQFDVEEVYGQTMGIVGYGEIGRAAAQCAKGLGMRVVAIKRRPDPGRKDRLVEHIYLPHQLHDLLRASDYVVGAAPHTPETAGMIGEDEIRNMKPSAVVINVGRGPVIVESALVRALQERRIKGAALDVFDQEPLPAGHPFYQLENVLLSPHCADHTANWLELAMQCFVDNFARYRLGQPLENIVDKAAGY